MTPPGSLGPSIERFVLDATAARAVEDVEVVQRLWGGYGELLRCSLDGGDRSSVIVKHVQWPTIRRHPRGWATDRSHERKVRSYRVETEWYQRYAARCLERSRVPECLAVSEADDEVVMVLEDLDAAGFGERRTSVDDADLEACLVWLANFHATFMQEQPVGLWPIGTYWHLDTRPDELAALDDAPLERAASIIDQRLNAARFTTFVHGDAKLANFCFRPGGGGVAGVDFQYVGGGCGMKDVAYFISSCLDEDESERFAPSLLDRYFELFAEAIVDSDRRIDADAVEAEWRELYPLAWTDFYRFLKGWSPGHWKLHRYSERLAHEVLHSL